MKKTATSKRHPRFYVSNSVLGQEELARNIEKTKSRLEANQDQILERLTKGSVYFSQTKEVGLLAGSINRL